MFIIKTKNKDIFWKSFTKQDYLAFIMLSLLFFVIIPITFKLIIPGLFFSKTIQFLGFYFEINSISSLFVLMTIFVFFLGVISNWAYFSQNLNILLIFNLIGFLISNILAFLSNNLLTFYFFFELTSIPILYLLFFYGKRNRKSKAAQMYLSFTLLGSILLFAVILLENSTIISQNLNLSVSIVFLIIAFFIKLPIFPFYLWLPEAHVESPTAGSVFLAGISLKLGGFGLFKFLLPKLNSSFISINISYIFFILICSLLVSSIAALVVHDFKKIVAYSSIAHMSLFTFNLFLYSEINKIGSILGMIAHSLTACSLFIIAGIIYDKFKTRNSLYFSGLITFMPMCGFFLLANILANISFPGTLSFVSEIIIFQSVAMYSIYFLILLLLFNSLVSIFSFKLIKVFFFGNVSSYTKFKFKDISRKDFYILSYFLIPQLFFGFFPNLIVNISLIY